jgi:hypothetical protein
MFLLLRSSLQARLTHLIRTWQRLSPHMAGAPCHPSLGGPPPPLEVLPADPVVAQLTLPLHFGGFSLCVTTSLEADAAFLAAAGTTRIALESAPATIRPFPPESPICTSLQRGRGKSCRYQVTESDGREGPPAGDKLGATPHTRKKVRLRNAKQSRTQNPLMGLNHPGRGPSKLAHQGPTRGLHRDELPI